MAEAAKDQTKPNEDSGEPVIAQDYESNPFKVYFGTFNLAGYNIGSAFALGGIGIGGMLIFLMLIGLGAVLIDQFELVAGLPVIIVAILAFLYGAGVLNHAFLTYAIAVNRRQNVSFSALFSGAFSRALGLLLLQFIIFLSIFGGLVLLIVPGIIIGIWFSLAQYVYVDEKAGIIESLSRSYELVKGKMAEIVAVNLLGTFFSNLTQAPSQAFAPLIFLTFPFVMIASWMASVAMAYRYVSASHLESQQLAKPPTNWTNWLVIGLYLGLTVLVVLIIILMIGFLGMETLNKS